MDSALLRFPQPSAYPALAEDQISASEVDEFSLPDCRLVIVDLGKGFEQLEERYVLGPLAERQPFV